MGLQLLAVRWSERLPENRLQSVLNLAGFSESTGQALLPSGQSYRAANKSISRVVKTTTRTDALKHMHRYLSLIFGYYDMKSGQTSTIVYIIHHVMFLGIVPEGNQAVF